LGQHQQRVFLGSTVSGQLFAIAALILCPNMKSIQAQGLANFEPSALTEQHHDSEGLFCLDSSNCTPGVIGMPRPKGIYVEYESDPSYRLAPKNGSQLATGISEARSRTTMTAGLRFPIISKHHTKVILGFKFRDENYDFESSNSSAEPFYRQLDRENLYSLGTSLHITHYHHNHSYWLVRAKASLDGDFRGKINPLGQYLNFSFTPVYGWKRSRNLSIGLGLAVKHAYGRFSYYPVLLYFRNFNEKWGLELAVPAKMQVRYRPNDHMNIYAGVRLEGTRNAILVPQAEATELLALERADLRYSIRLEREIYDFLWIGGSVGVRQPVSFRVADNFSTGFPRVYDADSRVNLFGSIGLFIVPPRKWLD